MPARCDEISPPRHADAVSVRRSSRASPARSGIYACGPTVYARVHVGNARPFVVFSLLKRFLEHEGYEATLVANITDINDKIYDAARERGASRRPSWPREMTAHYFADTEPPRARPARRTSRWPPRRSTAIVELIEALVERGHAYEAGGDVYFRVRSLRRLRRALAPRRRRDGPGRGRRGRRPQGGPARLRALEGAARRARTPPGTRRGARAARLAHRVLGDGRGAARRRTSTSTAAASTSSSPTTRTRRRRRWPAAGSRSRASGCTTGCSQLADEKMSKSVGQHRGLREVLDAGRRATRWSCTSRGGHYRQPIAFSRRARWRRPRAASSGSARRARRLGAGRVAGGAARRCATRSSRRWPTTSTPRGALAALYDWIREANRRDGAVGDAHLREMLGVLGLDDAARRAGEDAPAEAVELAERREAARGGARLRGGRPPARRARAPRTAARRLAATAPSGPRARWRRGCDDRLRPQRGARGAARAGGRSRRIWATERRPRRAGAGATVERRRADEIDGALRLATPIRASCAEVEPVPVRRRRELLAAPDPLHRRARRGHGPAEPRRRAAARPSARAPPAS